MTYALLAIVAFIVVVLMHSVCVILSSRRAQRKLVNAYKKFYAQAMQEENRQELSHDQALAVGQRVIDDLLNRVFDKMHYSEAEKIKYRKELETLIRKECPENLLLSPLIMTDEGFKKKM